MFTAQHRMVLNKGICKVKKYLGTSYLSLYKMFISAMILRKENKKSLPLVSKSLSDDALREVKKCIRLDKLNGNICRELGMYVVNDVYIN